MEWFKILILTVAVSVQVMSQDNSTEPPLKISKPKITVNLDHEVLYNTETVTLHCEVSEGPEELQYDWYKDSKVLDEHQPNITARGGGKYECKVKKGATESERSDSYPLTLHEPPEPQIQSKWTEAFPGEKVSLQCVIQDSKNWTYMWFKGSDSIVSSGEGNSLTLSVESSDDGKYVCQAELQDRKVTTNKSTPHPLKVKELPQLKLSIESQWKIFYPNEKVSLKCSVNEDSNKWDYEWFRNGVRLLKDEDFSFSGDTLSISSAKTAHSGEYTCRGRHQTRTPVTTRQAKAVQLHIQDNTPKPDIRKHQWFEPFYSNEQVQLDCQMSGTGWKYQWFKGSNSLNTNVGLSINSVSVSDAGDYHCKAQRGDFSVDSETLRVQVQNPPQPQIKSDWTEAFPGEKVSFQCVIQVVPNSWTYMWFKGSDKVVSDGETIMKGNSLTLSVKSSDDGEYVCQAELQDRKVTTEKSKQYSLKVLELPQPNLSISPQWGPFYQTEKVSLKCSVNEDSNKWDYEWFRNGDQLLKDKDFSFSGDTLSISSAKAAHSGEYICRGRHQTRTPVTTRQAEAVQLHIQDNTPKPDIRKHQWFEPFYSNERVQLDCQMSGTGWKYQWFKGSNSLNTNEGLSIDSVSVSDAGDYHCKAQRGDFSVDSKTLRVQVQNPPEPQIKSDWTEAFPGEKVSLQCVIQVVPNSWTYMWFKGSDKVVSDGETIMKGNTLTLSVKSSDDGEYVCQAELQDRKVTTANSKQYSLKVLELPQPNLSISPQWGSFYQTEKVTLKCSVNEDSNKWDYEWFRNGDQLLKNKDFSFSGDTLSISSAKAAHSGKYTCSGRHQTRTPVTTRQAEAVQLHIQDNTPKPDIRKHQWFEPFYSNERVQLDCQMSGTGWKYQWFKGSNSLNTNEGLSIDSVSVSDAGDYHCKAQRGDFSVDSETLRVQVQNPPQPQIKSDWTEAFPGEKVSFQCVIQVVPNSWTYMWFKGSDKVVSDGETIMKGNSLTLSVKSSDDGEYVCQAELQDRKVTTEKSKQYTIKVLELPQPNLSISPQWGSFYQTEKVTLKCSVNEDSNKWDYEWFRNGDQLLKDEDFSFSGDTLSISSAKAAHSGKYTCRGRHQTRTTVTTRISAAVQLHIQDNTPKPTISKHQWFEPFYTNERVQINCSMPGVGWEYQWNSDSKLTNPELTINSVSVSDTGDYHCKAQRGDFSVDSETLRVQVQKPPEPQIQSDWTEAFPGEKVSLQCVIQDSKNWTYMWFKDSDSIVSSGEGNSLTLSVKSSDDGEYVCQAQLQHRKVTTANSKQYSLKVLELPQPNLSISPQWGSFYQTEKVTLKCSVNEDSNKWDYEWFRNGDQLLKDKDFSFSGDTLSISSAKAAHSGEYICSGRHQTRTTVTTRRAEAVQLHVNETTPVPTITEHEWFDLFYIEERFQLNCSMSGVGWVYHWHKDSNPLITNAELTINSVSHTSIGKYYCRARRGDFSVDSKTLQVQVESRPPALLSLETELSDIMSGDMTLRCNVTDGRQWNYTWFKDGQQLNTSSDVLKVTGNAETIKSEFKCKGINTVRPLYSALSDGFIANNILFKRKILLAISGCLICCFVILIIGCIALKVTRKPGLEGTAQEDLFFSMTDSKNQTASPMEEYMDCIPLQLEECQEEEEKEELTTDHASAVHEEGAIKDEETPASEPNGLTSFKGL